MVKFMVLVQENGKVTRVKWCYPEKLITEGDCLTDVFARESKEFILDLVKKVGRYGSDDSIITQISLDQKIIPVTVFGVNLYHQIFVMGFDSDISEMQVCQHYINIYNEFVNKIREEFSNTIKERETSIKQQFEEIQELNNQLINTKRKLEKANIKLEAYNKELHGKLVRDPLTGLVSRHHYWTEIERVIQENPGKQGVFSFIDLDDFKFINDTYGHAAGDKFLIEFARRLQNMNLPDTVFIRIAGDEFALFTYGIDQVQSHFLEYIWSKIKENVLHAPIDILEFSVPVSISVGMAVYGVDTDNVNELIEYADFAMYRAKSKGKGCYYRFDKSEYNTHNKPDVMLREMNKIIEEKNIYHVYQPLVNTHDGSVYGYALMMRSGSNYFKGTRELLHEAVKRGKYKEISDLSFELLIHSINQCKNRLQGKKIFVTQGPYPLLRRESLHDNLLSSFLNHLVLEVTETTLSNLENLFQKAKEGGYQLAMRKIGSGYANDLMVLAVRPAFIKIDIDLVRDIHQDPMRQKMLQTMVKFAHQQGIKTVAEGVEKKEEMKMLIKLNLDYLQGYYLGVPGIEPLDLKEQIRTEITGVAQK